MGAFLESASRGTRLVPESMSHEHRNLIKPFSPARAGVPPRRCPKGRSLLSSSESGRQAARQPHKTQRTQSFGRSGAPCLRTCPAPQHLSALRGQCPVFPRGNSPGPHLPCRVITECRCRSFRCFLARERGRRGERDRLKERERGERALNSGWSEAQGTPISEPPSPSQNLLTVLLCQVTPCGWWALPLPCPLPAVSPGAKPECKCRALDTFWGPGKRHTTSFWRGSYLLLCTCPPGLWRE